ncbi:MAG: CtsR family transcriptional regulator [Ruminococcaceae bacterium]|nr:CtsR family transcriptional regulator [Oscillospiraceae bacterium]
MLISEQITRLIEKMIEEGDGVANIKRNDLAQSLGCVPSQVSYVISSRFTPGSGYMVESRRGGGGYIRIVRVRMEKNQYLEQLFSAIGDSLSENGSRECTRRLLEAGAVSDREALMILSATSDGALARIGTLAGANAVRADIMRQIIRLLMQ